MLVAVRMASRLGNNNLILRVGSRAKARRPDNNRKHNKAALKVDSPKPDSLKVARNEQVASGDQTATGMTNGSSHMSFASVCVKRRIYVAIGVRVDQWAGWETWSSN
jgi:L-serine deaminase